MPVLEEKILVDSWGEPAAIRVDLNDVVKFIKKMDERLTATAEFEDYDEYGCEHYVRVSGECADIILKKDYGGIYCPGDSLVCSVQPHTFKNRKGNPESSFELKTPVLDVDIGRDYADRIRNYLNQHKQYLNADNRLFVRTDYIWYRDCSGAFKFKHCNSSYDTLTLADMDFYAGKKKEDALWYQQRKHQFNQPAPPSDQEYDFI